MIRIYCSKADATLQETETLTAGMVNTPVVQFTFSSDWDGLGKSAIVRAGTVIKEVVVSNNQIIVPSECLAKAGVNLIIGVWGGNFTTELPTVWCACGEIQDATNPNSALNHEDATASNVAQMLAAAERAEAALDQIKNANWDDVAQKVGTEKVNKPLTDPNGTEGQVLVTNGDGSTRWEDKVLPTDEQVGTAVDNWLVEHPEATTTVQDNSLTIQKFTAETIAELKETATVVFMPCMYRGVAYASGDCTVFISPNEKKVMMIDSGSVHAYNKIKSELNELNVTHIDYFILTHFHSDHFGNIGNLVNDGLINSDTVAYFPKSSGITISDWGDETLARQNIAICNTIIEPDSSTSLIFDEINVTFFNCDDEDIAYYNSLPTPHCNDYSICNYVRIGATRILMTGDILVNAEQRLYERGYISQCDILKIPHHMHENIVSQDFYFAANPTYAISSQDRWAQQTYYARNSAAVKYLSALGTKSYNNGEDFVFLGVGKNLYTFYPNSQEVVSSQENLELYIHVDQNYTGQYCDGTSNHPFKKLQAAIAFAGKLKTYKVIFRFESDYIETEDLYIYSSIPVIEFEKCTTGNIYIDNSNVILEKVSVDGVIYDKNKKSAMFNLITSKGKIAADIDGMLGAEFDEIEVDINPVQTGTGTPSQNNVRAITGRSSANIYLRSRNLAIAASGYTHKGVSFSLKSDSKGRITEVVANGTATGGNANFNMTTGCFLKAGKYRLSGCPSGFSNCRLHVYYNDGSEHYPGIDYGNGTVFTLDRDRSVYITVRINNGATVNNMSFYPMIRILADENEEFVPFDFKTYTVDWNSVAGTVYGGKLIYTGEGNWKLLVTHLNIASYNGESLPGEWISSMDVYSEGGTPTAGAQVVYKLSTPTEYTISTGESIAMLEGRNNIFANTGNILVRYGNYISKIAQS